MANGGARWSLYFHLEWEADRVTASQGTLAQALTSSALSPVSPHKTRSLLSRPLITSLTSL